LAVLLLKADCIYYTAYIQQSYSALGQYADRYHSAYYVRTLGRSLALTQEYTAVDCTLALVAQSQGHGFPQQGHAHIPSAYGADCLLSVVSAVCLCVSVLPLFYLLYVFTFTKTINRMIKHFP
jgi:hypothetical protein